VSNDTSTNATTYTYTSQLENNTTNVEQAFTFSKQETSGNFSGLTFTIGASTVKWSIRLSAINTTITGSGAGLTLRYRLAGLVANDNGSSTTSQVPATSVVVVQRETPRANMTTYLVPLFVSITTTTATKITTTRTTVVKVEVFDVALVDGTGFVPINHSIVRTSANGTDDDEEEASYVVELALPGFNESLYYDPSIGLGVLLGRSDGGEGGGSDSSNVGLIVGVAVAIPVAVVLVLLVIGAALAIGWHRNRSLARRHRGAVNFQSHDQL
jgi:hypothetical protein